MLGHEHLERSKNIDIFCTVESNKNFPKSRKNVLSAPSVYMCILYQQRDATYTMFFILTSALDVSGGFSAHHQEIIKLCVPAVGSNPSTPAVDSRKA